MSAVLGGSVAMEDVRAGFSRCTFAESIKNPGAASESRAKVSSAVRTVVPEIPRQDVTVVEPVLKQWPHQVEATDACQIVEVPHIIKQERIVFRHVEQIVEVPVPMVVEEIVYVPVIQKQDRLHFVHVEQELDFHVSCLPVEVPQKRIIQRTPSVAQRDHGDLPPISQQERAHHCHVGDFVDLHVPQVDCGPRAHAPIVQEGTQHVYLHSLAERPQIARADGLAFSQMAKDVPRHITVPQIEYVDNRGPAHEKKANVPSGSVSQRGINLWNEATVPSMRSSDAIGCQTANLHRRTFLDAITMFDQDTALRVKSRVGRPSFEQGDTCAAEIARKRSQACEERDAVGAMYHGVRQNLRDVRQTPRTVPPAGPVQGPPRYTPWAWRSSPELGRRWPPAPEVYAPCVENAQFVAAPPRHPRWNGRLVAAGEHFSVRGDADQLAPSRTHAGLDACDTLPRPVLPAIRRCVSARSFDVCVVSDGARQAKIPIHEEIEASDKESEGESVSVEESDVDRGEVQREADDVQHIAVSLDNEQRLVQTLVQNSAVIRSKDSADFSLDQQFVVASADDLHDAAINDQVDNAGSISSQQVRVRNSGGSSSLEVATKHGRRLDDSSSSGSSVLARRTTRVLWFDLAANDSDYEEKEHNVRDVTRRMRQQGKGCGGQSKTRRLRTAGGCTRSVPLRNLRAPRRGTKAGSTSSMHVRSFRLSEL